MVASRRKALAFEKWAQTFAPVPDDTTLEELSPAIVSEIVSLVLEDGQGGRSSVDRVARFFPEEDIGVASADLQNALEGLSTVGKVTVGAYAARRWTVTFHSNVGDLRTLVVDDATLASAAIPCLAREACFSVVVCGQFVLRY